MNKYPDYKLVQKCLLQIEEKLGWGNSDQWHNEVFIELSEKIQEATNVLLSATTLKRIWGKVRYKNAPSINTLNTLSQFVGYTNWRDFKSKAEEKPAVLPLNKSIPNLGVVVASAAFMTLLFISLYSLVGSDANQSINGNRESTTFSSRPIVDGLPNSVVFDFDLKGLKSDSILIQQFWDPTKTIKIKETQKQATGIYYYPGYFRAKLLVDGAILKEHDLFIKSNNWIGTIDYEPVPKYVDASKLINGQLSFLPSVIDEISANEKPVNTSFHLVDDFENISGDNFQLETAIRNVYKDKWGVCQKVRIVILGKTGAMIIPFSIPGCVSDIGLMCNDVFHSGKEHDLSALGFDFSDYKKIAIEVEEKQLRIWVANKLAYAVSYNKPIGDLVGIRYRFLGAGEVRDLIVTNSEGAPVLEEDFRAIQ